MVESHRQVTINTLFVKSTCTLSIKLNDLQKPVELSSVVVTFPLTFSRFEVHSVRHDVLQLHQFQLDRVYAAESTERSLAGDEHEVGERGRRAEVRTAGTVFRG